MLEDLVSVSQVLHECRGKYSTRGICLGQGEIRSKSTATARPIIKTLPASLPQGELESMPF